MRKRSNTAACWLTLALGTLLPPTPAHAADEWQQFVTERWYRVEVVIFERPHVSAHSTEAKSSVWSGLPHRHYPARMHAIRLAPDEIQRRYPIRGDGCNGAGGVNTRVSVFSDRPRAKPSDANQPTPNATPAQTAADVPEELRSLQRQVTEIEQAYFESSYRWLSRDAWQLRPQASTLERRGGMNVLFHGAWHQPVPERSAPSPLLFQQGPMAGRHHRLEGTLGVTVGRYLHFHAQLWLHSAIDPMSGSGANQPTIGATVADPFRPATEAGGTYVELYESRRMRSGELNYLDHPNFGILVKIEPLDIESDLAGLPPTG